MSVILECQPGDEFVCMEDFHASPEGEAFSWDTSRNFHVGERLRYVGFQQSKPERPTDGMVCHF